MRTTEAALAVSLLGALSACSTQHCTPVTCPGCCDANDTCRPGTELNNCGSAGRTCTACSGGMGCSADGSCKACGPSTCTGCCDVNGACVMGDAKSACGSAGASCAACAVNQMCASASHACADDPDQCRPDAGLVTTATLQAALFTARCGTCHTTGGSGDGYANFTTAQNTQLVVNKKSIYAGTLAQLKIVDTNNLANSTLWLKVSATGLTGRKGPHNEATGAAEPQDGTGPLSAAQQQQVKDWICTGAQP